MVIITPGLGLDKKTAELKILHPPPAPRIVAKQKYHKFWLPPEYFNAKRPHWGFQCIVPLSHCVTSDRFCQNKQ